MDEYDDLTPAMIWHIACDVQEGESNPHDARRLLDFYCKLQEDKQPIPKELLLHLRQAFRAYLDGKRTLESALGLVRKKARPKADPKMRAAMALEVLKLRLNGSSHQNALEQVEGSYGYVKSVVGEAWRQYKTEAWCLLRLEQKLGAYPMVTNQIERLEKILGAVSPLQAYLAEIAPEKSRTRPA